MEILYIWVENYKIHNNIGLNFNSNIHFFYDSKERKLEYIIKRVYPKSFFGTNIENISAIVGNNGAGKSTLLNMIINKWISPKNLFGQMIIVCQEEDEIIVYFNDNNKEFNKDNMNIENKNKKTLDIDILVDKLDYNFFEKIHLIYYSSVFEKTNFVKHNRNITDISTVGLINNIEDCDVVFPEFKYVDKNLRYFYDEFEKQIRFITRYEEHLPFEKPVEVYASFVDLTDDIRRISKIEGFSNIGNVLEEWNEEIYDNKIVIDKQLIFESKMLKCSFYSLIKDMTCVHNRSDYKKLNSSIKLECKNINKNTTIEQYLKFLNHFKKSLENQNLSENVFVNAHINFISWLIANRKRICILNNIGYDTFIIPTNNNTNFVGINIFFEQYCGIAQRTNLLNFEWGLSTGENTLLSIFSRFNSIKENISSKSNLLILMDELDISLHPEWQQKIVKYLIEFLSEIYINCNSIQLLIATHSPIILSDLPKGNVIYLTKTKLNNNWIYKVEESNNHEETFGANIATLFYDSFVMKRGSIGQFAKDKINLLIKAMINEVQNEDGQKEIKYSDKDDILEKLGLDKIYEVYDLINMIGEPVLKAKLEDLLNKCLIKNNTKDYSERLRNRIDEAQREIDEAQRELGVIGENKI